MVISFFPIEYHLGSENEICAVTRVDMADTNGTLINNREISDVRFVAPQALLRELSRDRDSYTPWLLLTVEELKSKLQFKKKFLHLQFYNK